MAALLPVGALFLLLLLFEERKAHGSHGSKKANMPNTVRDKAATSPKIHRNFYPPPGSVMVMNDPSWEWDGHTWYHNGQPGFPDHMPLIGVPGGPLDGWAYDWVYQAWYEPGALIHKGFYPPKGSVGVKGDASWYWDGKQWLKNGKADFPGGKTLEGVKGGPLDGWTYNWKLQAWLEPGALESLLDSMRAGQVTAKTISPASKSPAPSAPKPTDSGAKSTIKVTSIPQADTSAPVDKKSVIREIATLKQNPDPHPAEISRVAVLAQAAGLPQTAQTLQQKADAKAVSTITVTSIPNTPQHEPESVSTISVVTDTGQPLQSIPLSNAQQALEHSLTQFSHAADLPPAPTMTFDPEVITHSPDASDEYLSNEHLTVLPSPIAGVDDHAWTAFVTAMETPGNKVTDKWELGLWKVNAKRLQDLGLATNARQVNRNGKSVWIADFVPPLSMQIFVNDEHKQYEEFSNEMDMLSKAIDNLGMSNQIPLDIHGQFPTKSGLLAVAHIAGIPGLTSFVKPGSSDWDKFPDTRAAFLKFNGLF